jgi:hypothetical protein
VSKKIQELVSEISNMRQALLGSVSGLSDAQLDYKPADGEWAISDILHHLALTDEANAKLVARSLKQAQATGVPLDPTPDESVLNCLDHLADKIRGTRAQAPEFVRPRAHAPAPESLARLNASREKMLESVEQLGEYDLAELKYPHPLLGDLNLYQWILIAGGHERRHVAQIGRIKSEAGFPQ